MDEIPFQSSWKIIEASSCEQRSFKIEIWKVCWGRAVWSIGRTAIHWMDLTRLKVGVELQCASEGMSDSRDIEGG